MSTLLTPPKTRFFEGVFIPFTRGVFVGLKAHSNRRYMSKKAACEYLPTLVDLKDIEVVSLFQVDGKTVESPTNVRVARFDQLLENTHTPYTVTLFTNLIQKDVTTEFGFGEVNGRNQLYERIDKAFCEKWMAHQIELGG